MDLTKGRIVIMSINIAAAYLVWGLLVSLQPPFYPQEAEKKGASPSQVIFNKPQCNVSVNGILHF